MDWWPTRETLLGAIVLLALLNLAFVGMLAATENLKTAESGDITYNTTLNSTAFYSEAIAPREISLPEDAPNRFADEGPTDVDIYYNAGLLVRYGNPLYVRGYKYAPPSVFIFVSLSLLGYVPFKIAWLFISAGAMAGGTYLLLRTETNARDMPVSRQTLVLLSLAAVGFGPAISNFKSGQITPLLYLFLAIAWTAARSDRYGKAGSLIALGALIKPYFGAPLFGLLDRAERSVTGYFAVYLGLIGLGVALLGIEMVLEYGRVVLYHALETESSSGRPIQAWSVEAVDPLFILGGFKRAVQAAVAAVLAYVALFGRQKTDPAVYSLSVVSIPFILSQASAVDLAAVLVPLVLLGVAAYQEDYREFLALVATAVLLHLHPWYMELFVGRGHWNIAGATPTWSHTLFALAQPGAIALVVLYATCLCHVEFVRPRLETLKPLEK